ncbi:MAG: hypothetical protein IJ748_06860 [Bacteroidales bacterium]|nr:hypothetical protein [Bacteroidales bacterium]
MIANRYLQSTYFGTQPFTAGPVYFGAIVIFLALLGFLIVDNKSRWWLLAATLVSVLLSWGNNFMILNEWLFYHLPLYNKFRTPSMALVIANVTMCIAAFFGLKAFLEAEDDKKKKLSLYISGGVTLLITLLCTLTPTLFSDFSSSNDKIFEEYLGSSFVAALQQDRQDMFSSDAMRSFIFIAIAFLSLFLYMRGRIKNSTIVFCIIGLAAVIDLWAVDKRYVNNEINYQSKYEALPNPSTAQSNILELVSKQKPMHYRVYNMAVNSFNDATTSYFLPSIGGYSAVKLQRYQDIIDFYLTNPSYKQKDLGDSLMLNLNPLRRVFLQASSMQGFSMPNLGVLNMLNARYIIINPNVFMENTEACGAAWFVDNVTWVNSADEEILALDNFNPKKTVVINKEFASQVKDVKPDADAKIEFLAENPDNPTKRVYNTSSAVPQIAVFSEIYYKDSWKAYLDGKEVPYFRANYVLRGMYVPAGKHKIEFVCKSSTLGKAKVINFIGSLLLVLLLCFALFEPKIKSIVLNKKNSKSIK